MSERKTSVAERVACRILHRDRGPTGREGIIYCSLVHFQVGISQNGTVFWLMEATVIADNPE